MLAEYQQPALDPGVHEALREFVTRRRADIQAGKIARDL